MKSFGDTLTSLIAKHVGKANTIQSVMEDED
jgi:hypothetical protein